MTYLLTAQIKDHRARTYRYFVELASNKLDYEGVPEHYQIVDVVVTEPTVEAIQTLIAATGWLEGHTMVSHWVPADECPF